MTIRTVHMDFLYGGAFRDGPAGGVRAADPRRDARRRDALHARGRGRGAVGARRRDRRGVAARPAGLPELRGRHVGPAVGRRAAPPRRPLLAAALDGAVPRVEDWTGEDVVDLRDRARAGAPAREAIDATAARRNQRTSVMTHIAWVPPDWLDAARADARRAWRSAIRRGRSCSCPRPDEPARASTRSSPCAASRSRRPRRLRAR